MSIVINSDLPEFLKPVISPWRNIEVFRNLSDELVPRESIFWKSYTHSLFSKLISKNDSNGIRHYLNKTFDPEETSEIAHKAFLNEEITDNIIDVVQNSTTEVIDVILEFWEPGLCVIAHMPGFMWANVIRNPHGVENIKRVIDKYDISVVDINFLHDPENKIKQELPDCERRTLLISVLNEGLNKYKEHKEHETCQEFIFDKPIITEYGSVSMGVSIKSKN